MEAISQTLQGYMPAFLVAVTGVVFVAILHIKEFINKHRIRIPKNTTIGVEVEE